MRVDVSSHPPSGTLRVVTFALHDPTNPASVACLALVAAISPSLANGGVPDEGPEDAAQRQRARRQVDAGNTAFEAHDFDAALARFEDAYRAFPSPKILLNIAECHREMRRVVEALSHYRRFLEVADLERDSPIVPRVRERIRELEAKVGRIGVEGVLEGVGVTIDGMGEHRAPFEPIVVSPGVHQIDLTKPGYQPVHISMSVLPGELAWIRAEFEPRLPSGSAARADASGDASVLEAWWFWGGIAAAVASAIVIGVAVSANGDSFNPGVELGRSSTSDAPWRAGR